MSELKAKSKTPYCIRKFKDGWWSVIKYSGVNEWGQWRGPFDTKAEAEIDCVNTLDRFENTEGGARNK